MSQYHYMTVISQGPLIIIRTPQPMPVWKDVIQALTPVMQSHGLRQKDIETVNGLGATGDSPEDKLEWAVFETKPSRATPTGSLCSTSTTGRTGPLCLSGEDLEHPSRQ